VRPRSAVVASHQDATQARDTAPDPIPRQRPGCHRPGRGDGVGGAQGRGGAQAAVLFSDSDEDEGDQVALGGDSFSLSPSPHPSPGAFPRAAGTAGQERGKHVAPAPTGWGSKNQEAAADAALEPREPRLLLPPDVLAFERAMQGGCARLVLAGMPENPMHQSLCRRHLLAHALAAIDRPCTLNVTLQDVAIGWWIQEQAGQAPFGVTFDSGGDCLMAQRHVPNQ
jgi:hypothetical protein